ncbi:MAG TPA: hypothetical protein VMU81_13095, partial [Acetobacteraceae bacterium]|nr:hypothetical protein [Acetobacteraceae bacterium]
PAHQSMINRRFMIVPPALPSGEHAEQLEETSEGFSRLLLEMANIRVLGSGDATRHAALLLPGMIRRCNLVVCMLGRSQGLS